MDNQKTEMTKEEFVASRYFKILMPLLAVVFAIGIWRGGYEFGQWLHTMLN